MTDTSRTKQELIEENALLKQKNKELEQSELERKRVEEALRASEAFSRSLIRYVHEAVVILSWEGIILFANEAAAKLVDIASSEEMSGRNMVEFLHPDSLMKAVEDLESVKAGIEGFPSEYRLSTTKGRQVWVESIGGRIIFRGKESNLVCLHDITERKNAEEALQESEEKYRLFAENMADVIAVLDMNLHFTYVSPSIMRLRGLTVEEAMKETLDQVMTPESLNIALAAYEEEMKMEASGKADPDRIRILELEEYRKDGSTIWVETSLSYLRDEDNKPVGMLSTTRNITDRKQAEEALRESEERYRRLFELSNDAIFLIDIRTGQYLDANHAAEKLTGRSVDELKLLTTHDVTPKKSADRLAILRSSNETIDFSEIEYLRPDGTTRTALLGSVPLSENIFYGVAYDITERKRAEEEKRSLEERLNRAEKMESLGILAGGVAHDLNNVLGIVVGYAEMLLFKANESSTIRPSLVEIMKGGQKAAAIVDDLLTMARRGVTGRDVLNLNKIIADCQRSPEFVNLSFNHPSVKIITDPEPDLQNISGSSVHLGKSIYNLVSNASEAMPKGGIVTIKTTNQYLDKPIHGYDKIREGDYVVLSVSDTGEGIHEADMRRIFEPFYTKKVMGRSGTGLGLSVVWGTVKDHNGYINIQSEEGKGSTFTLYFPVTRKELPAEYVAESISEYMGKGESILIVDDVKEQRALAAVMLKELNYSVTSVESGEEAVAYLKEHKADLMVLDMIMDPGMDGLDTYRRVLEIRPKQKAIIVSGFSETDRVKAARALGAGAYVRKPYVIEKLGQAVKKELDRATGTREEIHSNC